MRKSLFIAAVLITLSIKSASPQEYHDISLTIKGAENSFVSLAYHLGDKQYIKDTISTDENGTARYTGEDQLDKGLYMIVFPDNNLFEVIIDDDQVFSLSCDRSDVINTLEFSGSDENNTFIRYRNKWAAFQKKSNELRKELQESNSEEIQKELKTSEAEILEYIKTTANNNDGTILASLLRSMLPLEMPDFEIDDNHPKADSLRWINAYHYNRDHFLDNIDLSDPRLIRTPVIHNKLKVYLTNIVIQAPDSLMPQIRKIVDRADDNQETFRYIVVFLFNHFRESQIMGHDAILVMLADEYYLSGRADWVDEKFLEDLEKDVAMIRHNLIGLTATDLTMETFGGNWRSLSDIDSEFTIIYFWEPHCGHCATTTPKLKDLYNKNKDKGWEVFSVCTQDNKEEWEAYIADNELNWINGWDPDRSSHFDFYYNVTATPLLYILDKNKKIIAKKIPVDNIEGFIDNYLRMNPGYQD